MKRVILVVVFAGFWADVPGVGWASDTTASFRTSNIRTPTVNSSAQNSNMHSINNKIRFQTRQIHKDVKAGKLTPEQAKAQMEKLKAIRRQELDFFRQNGKKEITPDQKRQLEKMLN